MTEAGARTRVRIGELWVDSLSFDQALEEITHLIESKRGGAVFTPNIDHVVTAEQDVDLRNAYAAVTLSLVDGQPLVWASRLLGSPLPAKISGSDLVMPLMKRAAAKGWRVYLVGAAPGIAEQVAGMLTRELGVKIAGVDAPIVPAKPDLKEDDPVIGRIRAARPEIVLVAFGCPKQELWIHAALPWIRPALALGVGTTFDFIAGRVRRAPPWMSRSGLEWLFRLVQEPGRLWRRYLIKDVRFAWIFLRTLRTPRRDRVGPAELDKS